MTQVIEPMKYREARSLALLRDWYECRNCLAQLNLTVHHIWPRGLGGGNDPANLVTLCEKCHQNLCSTCSRDPALRDPEWSRGQGTRSSGLARSMAVASAYLQEWVV